MIQIDKELRDGLLAQGLTDEQVSRILWVNRMLPAPAKALPTGTWKARYCLGGAFAKDGSWLPDADKRSWGGGA